MTRRWARSEIGSDIVANPTDEQKKIPALAGAIGQTRTVWARLRSLFFADPMRWPSYGGHTVNADETVYRIVATAQLKDRTDPVNLEIHTGRFADRAIVDFVKTI